MKKLLIVLLILVVIFGLGFYAAQKFLLNKAKVFIVTSIEKSTNKGVEIKSVGYIPMRGVRARGITVYKDLTRRKKELFVNAISANFSLFQLITKKIFAPEIKISNLEFRDISVGGFFSFSFDLNKKPATALDFIIALGNLSFRDFTVKSPFLTVSNITGSVKADSKSIECSNVSFSINDKSATLDFRLVDPREDFSSELEITLQNLKFSVKVKKEKDIYKIPYIKGVLYNSNFDFMGEFSMQGESGRKTPLMSLYGKSEINLKDVIHFVPHKFRKNADVLKPEGIVKSSVYFNGDLSEPEAAELGIKSEASRIGIWNFRLDNFSADMRVKDRILRIPMVSSYPYGGVLMLSSVFVDFGKEGTPYAAELTVDRINLNSLFKKTDLGKRNIVGKFAARCKINGMAKDLSTMTGSGSIGVTDANLGPMPLLTPLLGSLYGYFQKVIPGLKTIDITAGEADLVIKDKKIGTNNLVLHGGIVNIYARGYIGFDKTLNFEVENKITEIPPNEKEDWQTALQEMLARVGTIFSKAYLTGTLDKPEWSFKYFGGVKNALESGIGRIKDFFKGISE